MNFLIHKGVGALLVSLALVLPASAAKISISSVRVDLTKQKPTALLTLTNKGDSKAIMQIDPVSWRQVKGESLYTPTEELLAVPALFELQPGASQLIRVGLRKVPECNKERAYRLYLSELPDASASLPESVHVTLKIGIPVFVHSATPEVSALHWSGSCVKKGELHLEASNSGNAHIRILDLTLKSPESKKQFAKSDLADYILAGTSRSWEIGISSCPEAGRILELSAATDAGPVNAKIILKE